jgi:hypothetical protein
MTNDSHLRMTVSESESESYVTTDGQSASLPWNKAPIWGLRPEFYNCQTVPGLLMSGALSNERTGLSFTVAAGARQRSHSRVRGPWDSRPCFSVSDSILPLSSPPTTRRATMEVFDPASTREMTVSSLHGPLYSLAESMESVCCLFVSKENFVVCSFTRKCLLY